MKLLKLFCRKDRPEPVTESSAAEPLLAAALAVLEAGAIAPQAVRRYACSADGRFCALTLDDYRSYGVDRSASVMCLSPLPVSAVSAMRACCFRRMRNAFPWSLPGSIPSLSIWREMS